RRWKSVNYDAVMDRSRRAGGRRVDGRAAPITRCASSRLHRADEIGEPLARLVRIAALKHLQPRDPGHAEIAEVRSPPAPGAYRPGAAPVVERERPDVALARLSARVAVIEAQHAARADRFAHRFQLPHGAAVDVESRRVEARLLHRDAPVGG